jgi:hypothetical protein
VTNPSPAPTDATHQDVPLVAVQPLLVTRAITSCFFALLTVWLVDLVWVASGPVWWRPAGVVLLALVGMLVTVRAYRQGVWCDGNQITVRGLLWTRQIPKAWITNVTDFPAIRWRSPGTALRWTPVIAFWVSGQELPVFRMHADQCMDLIEQHAHRHTCRRWHR